MINLTKIRCPCGQCEGYGSGLYKDDYNGNVKAEMYHKYEYPGIHSFLVNALILLDQHVGNFVITSGYRCSIRMMQTKRTSTNHCGKAVDIMGNVEEIREFFVHYLNAQVGWYDKNKFSIEPKKLSPTWVHIDVRQFDKEFLQDQYFVKI